MLSFLYFSAAAIASLASASSVFRGESLRASLLAFNTSQEGTTTTTTGNGGSGVTAIFYLDDTCTNQAFNITPTKECYDVTDEMKAVCDSVGIPVCPFSGVELHCSGKEVQGIFYFSAEEGYGDKCDPTSYTVDIPALETGECFSIGIDGVGVGFEASCSQ